MREQLKLLEELQQVDIVLHDKKKALTELPAKLESLKADVSKVEQLLQAERLRLEEAERYRAELQVGIKASQDQMNKAKAKLNQVRTSKEYMATQRELDATRKSTQDREDEKAKLDEAVSQNQETVAKHQSELDALKAHVAEEERETEERLTTYRREAEELQVRRDQMAAGIRKDLLRQYDWVKERRGNAVVPARGGVCTGCNMMLPPQLFNILQRGESVESCPSCRRIVYFEVEEEGGEV